MKTCKRCGEVKSADIFTGLLCSPCHTEYQAEYYQANRERKLEAARIRRESNRECNREYAKRYRQEHPQKYRDALRAWRSDNPEKLSEYRRKRDALKRGASDSIPYTRQQVWDDCNGDCYWCGIPMLPPSNGVDPLTFSIDHVVPLNRGGADSLDSVVGAHFNCNQSHSNKLISELPEGWAEERRMIMEALVGQLIKENS